VRRTFRVIRGESQLDAFLAWTRGKDARRDLREEARLDAEWRATWLRSLSRGITTDTRNSWGTPDATSIPLVMCLWNRPERIHDIVSMLETLDGPPVRVLFWNNAPDKRESYSWLADHAPRGSLTGIDLYTSDVNIGGLARFVATRLLTNSGYTGPVLFLDDDQDVSPSFVSDLLADYAPRSIVGWWAFDFGVSYWERVQIDAGSTAQHVGTGGMVFDSALVRDDQFFADLPRRYAFLEDQWMSHFALLRGWTLKKARTHIEFVLEHTNQYHAMIGIKDEFFWQVYGTDLGAPRRGRRNRAWSRGRVR